MSHRRRIYFVFYMCTCLVSVTIILCISNGWMYCLYHRNNPMPLCSSSRQRVCCGIIYKGRFGEVLIDPHLFKPCCRKKQQRQRQELEEEEGYEEEEVEVVEVTEEEEVVKRSNSQKSLETPQLQVTMTTPQTVEEGDW